MSIAMDPYPFIVFALRMPSQMASSLEAAQPGQACHTVVNLLCAEQASIFVKFSRPDLYSSIPYSLSEEGLPIIVGSLAAISCKLVSKALPVARLGSGEGGEQRGNDNAPIGGLSVFKALRCTCHTGRELAERPREQSTVALPSTTIHEFKLSNTTLFAAYGRIDFSRNDFSRYTRLVIFGSCQI